MIIRACSLLLLLAACTEQSTQRSEDFEELMGKGLPQWEHVQTTEDRKNLHRFSVLYAQSRELLRNSTAPSKIPKILHFIWIGPKAFPSASIENIKSWIAHHPDWKIKFWTDRLRPLPHPSVELVLINDFPWTALQACFAKTDNPGERSDLLRYEILYREGGIYFDHDVKCLHCFDPLTVYDLYCGLELPAPTVLSSSIHATNNLIGVRPGHPILKETMQWVVTHWDRLELAYPGRDRDSVVQRVAHRTFNAFDETFKALAGQEGRADIAFPALYFNAPDDKLALFARHLYAGTWFDNETSFEKMTRERLMLLSKKANKILLLCGVGIGLNLMGFGLLFYNLRKNTLKIRAFELR